MPRPPKQPLEEMIDRLAELAQDYLYSAADRLKEQLQGMNMPNVQPQPRSRAQGGGTGPRKRVQGTKHPAKPATKHRPPVRTAYTVLGVTPDAEQEVLVAAHRAKSRLYHPDLNKDPKAVGKMQELNLAWEILKDPVKRHEYDRRMGL